MRRISMLVRKLMAGLLFLEEKLKNFLISLLKPTLGIAIRFLATEIKMTMCRVELK